MEFFNRVLFTLTIWQWLVFIVGAPILMGIMRLVLRTIIKRTEKHIKNTKTDLDDLFLSLLQKVYNIVLLAVAVWVLQLFLPFTEAGKVWFRVIFLSCIYLQIGRWIPSIYSYLFRRSMENGENGARQASLELVVKILSWISWIILTVMAVDSLPGVDATTLIATMGVGGIAIAFALQNILADFASALTIAFDQPFEEGDGILVEDIGGTVEKIGLKSTRLRSWDGQEIVFANSDLLTSRINNYKQMERRRVVLNFGVVYQTTADELERIPEMVEEIITGMGNTTYGRTHSTILNDSSIDFETMYWVDSPDYDLFMERRHQINIAMIRRFEQEGIEFAYPTRTVIVEKEE